MGREQIENIHNSLVNGNHDQVRRQIREYGDIAFFFDYPDYLISMYDDKTAFRYFHNAMFVYSQGNLMQGMLSSIDRALREDLRPPGLTK